MTNPLYGERCVVKRKSPPRAVEKHSDQAPSDPPVTATPDKRRTKSTRFRSLALSIGGIFLIAMGLGLWIFAGDPGTTVTSETTSPALVSEGAPGHSVVTTTTENRAVAPPEDRGRTVETTTVESPVTTTTTMSDPGTTSTRSHELTIALISLGAGLLLLGAFFERIAKLTFPGGFAIEMSPETVAQVLRLGVAANPDALQDRAFARGMVRNAVSAMSPGDLVEVSPEFLEETVDELLTD